jgi:PKD repeat protein
MIAGYKNLWRSTNVKTSNPGSVSWTKLTNSLGGTNSENIHIIEQSEADPDILYFYREDNKLFRSDNFNNSSPGFTDISSSLPYSSYSYSLGSDLEAHPTNSNIVYLTLYQGVYKSTNKGAAWTDISANLPSISVNCIVIDTASSNEALYVGTDAGVYYKDNTMSNWVPFMDGMPAAAEITELEIYYNSSNHQLSKLVASTYGRGLWRSDLYGSGALLPVVDFGYDQSVICTGDTIQFTDSTTFNPSGWSWTFLPSTVSYVGGTTSSSQNPKVKFSTAGYYTVSLTATNSNGSATETKTGLIKVGGLQVPFLETFESNSTTIGEWKVSNPDNDKTWQLASGLGGTTPGNRAVTLNHYSYSTPGQRDNLFSPALNLTNVSTASMTFKHAYTRYPNYASDSLIIYASSDCGASWIKMITKAEDGTGNHATAPDNTYSSSNNFEPSSSSDWCGAGVGPNCYTINLNSFAGNDDVILRFEAYNNYSNNLYLDNIQVNGSSSSPVTASFTTTTNSICVGQSVGFTSTSQNATSYQWKENGVLLSTAQSFNRTFFTAGTYQIWLIASNSNDVDSTSQTITVNPLPGYAATPSGNTALCINPANTVYSTSGATNATNYVWNISPSSAGTISGSGASITVDWDNNYTGVADITVKGTNNCGDGSFSAPLTVTISDLPGAAGQPNGSTNLCKDAPNTVYVTGGASNASSYQWSLSPASAGTISGSGTMITVDWDNSFTGIANVIVQGVNNCGTGASATLSVNITELPATPGIPSGSTTLCENPGTISYTVPVATGASTYYWQLQPGSAGTVSGTTNSVDVSWNSSFTGTASLSVAAVNSCGTGSFSAPLSISVNANPPVPTISQSNDTLFSSSPTGNQWYLPNGSIIGAVYQYFVPSTNSVYYVVVTDSNGCSAQSAPYSYSGSSAENILNNKRLSIYPNPVSEVLTVEYSGSDVLLLKMTNKLGQEVQRAVFSNEQEINVSKLSSGIYFVEIRIKDNPSEKIIWKIFVE